jgi:hypothetical protein
LQVIFISPKRLTCTTNLIPLKPITIFSILLLTSPSYYQISPSTKKEGGESQTTQLILSDVIFMKLHVSARSGHLQVSHQKRGNAVSMGICGRDLYLLSPIYICIIEPYQQAFAPSNQEGGEGVCLSGVWDLQ